MKPLSFCLGSASDRGCSYVSMPKPVHRTKQLALLSFLFFGSLFLFFFLSSTSGSNPLFCFRYGQHHGPAETRNSGDELDAALAGASTANKTVIITVVNRAYVDSAEGNKPMLDLFLDSFWFGEGTRGLVDHLLVVAVDQTAYERCRFLRLHCFRLKTEGVEFDDKEKLYMSADFIKMMWRRTQFLGDVLRRGYDFVFTDTDVMWLRNPFERLKTPNRTFDLQISTDFYDPRFTRPAQNAVNTGFYFVRSNNKTIALFDAWYERRANSSGLKDQDVLHNMIRSGVLRRAGLGVRVLDTTHFSGFCENSKDVRAVATVHANCCRTITAKLADLQAVIRDWKRFKAVDFRANATASLGGVRHMACERSWA